MNERGPCFLVALSLLLALAAAALRWCPEAAVGERAPDVDPAPRTAPFAARCALRGVEARLHAQALEQRARLHWQRAPFEGTEAARATQLSAEAEVCYRAAGDRGGAQRAASRHRRYAAETATRERAAELRVQRTLATREDAP